MDEKILTLCREDSRFAYEAYEFVCDAVTYTQTKLGRTGTEEEDPTEDHRRISAVRLRTSKRIGVIRAEISRL